MTSRLVVDTIQASTLGGNMVTIPTGQKLYAPGHVIQIQQTLKTDVFSTTSSSYVDVTGLSVTINPSSINSKMLVVVAMSASFQGPSTNNDGVFQVIRANDSVAIGNSADGYSMQVAGQYNYQNHSKIFFYLDSPGTVSALTYKVQAKWISTGTVYVNARGVDGGVRNSSTISVMEIGG